MNVINVYELLYRNISKEYKFCDSNLQRCKSIERVIGDNKMSSIIYLLFHYYQLYYKCMTRRRYLVTDRNVITFLERENKPSLNHNTSTLILHVLPKKNVHFKTSWIINKCIRLFYCKEINYPLNCFVTCDMTRQ